MAGYFNLDTGTGKPQRTTPNSTAFEKDLYAQPSDDEGGFSMEALFAIVEQHAAAAIRRLTGSTIGAVLSPEDLQTLSYFLAFQYNRSPVSIEWTTATGNAVFGMFLAMQAGDAVAFAREFRDNFNADATDAEIEKIRAEIHDLIRFGRIQVPDGKGQVFKLLLDTADEIATLVSNLRWRLLYSRDAEFISSDRPLAVFDPSPRFPWSAQGWVSSPDVETTFPLSPRHCLCIEPGEPECSIETVAASDVRAINLRTYAWASRYVYGRTQELVSRVRREAKQIPELVHRPRRPVQVMLEEADEHDPSVGREYAARGWPRGLWIRQPDGSQVFASYTLVDPTDPKSVLAAIEEAPAVGRRVIERAIARGQAPPDRLG